MIPPPLRQGSAPGALTPQRHQQPRDRAAVTVYALVNVVTRGGLAILSVYAATDLHWSAATTAALAGYATLVMRFGRVLIAPLLNRIRTRSATLANLVAVCAGAGGLAVVHTSALIVISVTLLGVGYGGTVLTIKTELVRGSAGPPVRTLGRLAVALNIGAALGPVVAGVSNDHLGGRATYAVLAGGAVITAAVAAATMDRRRPADGPEVPDSRPVGRLAVHAGPLLGLIAVAFGLYAQIYSVMPVLVDERLGGTSSLGVLFAANAVAVVVLQQPITRWIGRRPRVAARGAAAGTALFATAVAVLAGASSLLLLLSVVLIASIAECLVLPLLEAELTRLVDSRDLAVTFAWSAAAMGGGESVGAFFGVRAALSGHGASFLLIVAAVGGLAAGADATLGGQWRSPLTPTPHRRRSLT